MNWAVAPLMLLLAFSCDAFAGPQIQRSSAEVLAFKRQTPCPSTGLRSGTCPGHVIDHMWPLACGGEDHPRNMQWQTLQDAKDKDKWERKVCGTFKK